MSQDFAPYSALTDEELLRETYTRKGELTALELELATRLEHALDAAHRATPSLNDLVTRGEQNIALSKLSELGQDLGLYDLPLDLD